MTKISRREFLQKGALAASAFMIAPSSIFGKSHGFANAPSDKLNIAAVGIGGMGNSNIRNMEKTDNIVALCDVDWKYSKDVMARFPNAKKYWDYRKMFDEISGEFDAVLCATADHTHAIITSDAITMGKHVYTQKPMTHSVYETRLLTKLANKYKIASQMGNQGSSSEGTDLVCEWIWNGEIGEVTKVECATNRPIWPQGLNAPETVSRIPKTLNWDLFTGPAKMRPFNEVYHPWNWRGWWDYGTGALGDMACHIMQPVVAALKLGYPTKIQGSSTLLLADCAPNAQHVKFMFPARENMPKVAMPEVEVHWYDGGIMPDRPAGFPEGKALMPGNGGLCIFHGTKDTLICSCYGQEPWLLSGRVPNAPKVCRRVENAMRGGHEQDWIRACKESAENRTETKSNFNISGPLNEVVVMGVLAVRLQELHKELLWDGENMEFTNINPNEEIRILKKDDFKVVDGDPKFNKIYNDPINAQEFARELIKHNYREGWKLVDMPK